MNIDIISLFVYFLFVNFFILFWFFFLNSVFPLSIFSFFSLTQSTHSLLPLTQPQILHFLSVCLRLISYFRLPFLASVSYLNWHHIHGPNNSLSCAVRCSPAVCISLSSHLRLWYIFFLILYSMCLRTCILLFLFAKRHLYSSFASVCHPQLISTKLFELRSSNPEINGD